LLRCRAYDIIEVEASEWRVKPSDIEALPVWGMVFKVLDKATRGGREYDFDVDDVDEIAVDIRVGIRDVFLTEAFEVPKSVPLWACINEWNDVAAVTYKDVEGKDFVHAAICNANELLCLRFRVPTPAHLLVLQAFERATGSLAEVDVRRYAWYLRHVHDYAEALESLARFVLKGRDGSSEMRLAEEMIKCAELGRCDYSDIGLLWRLGRSLEHMLGPEKARKLEEVAKSSVEKCFGGLLEAEPGGDDRGGRGHAAKVAAFIVPRARTNSFMPERPYISGKLLLLKLDDKPGEKHLLHRLAGYHDSIDVWPSEMLEVYGSLLKEAPGVSIEALKDLQSLVPLKDLDGKASARLVSAVAGAIAKSYKKKDTADARNLVTKTLSPNWEYYAHAIAVVDPKLPPPWLDPSYVVLVNVRAHPRTAEEQAPVLFMLLKHLKKHGRFMKDAGCEACTTKALKLLRDTRPSWEGKLDEKVERMIKDALGRLEEKDRARESASVGH